MAVMRGNFSRGALVDPFANLMKAFSGNGAMAKSMMARDQYQMDMLKDKRLVEARDIQESQFGKTQAQQLLMQSNRFGQQDKTIDTNHKNNIFMTEKRHANSKETATIANDRSVLKDTVFNDRKVTASEVDDARAVLAAEETQRNTLINKGVDNIYKQDAAELKADALVTAADVTQSNRVFNDKAGWANTEKVRQAGSNRVVDAATAYSGASVGPLLANGGPGVATGQAPATQNPVLPNTGVAGAQAPAGGATVAPIMNAQPSAQQQVQNPLINGGQAMVAPTSASAVVGKNERQIKDMLMAQHPPQTAEDVLRIEAMAKQLHAEAGATAKAQNSKTEADINAFVKALHNTDATQQSGEAVDIQAGFSQAYDNLFASTNDPKVLQAGLKKLMKTFNQAGDRGMLKDSMAERDKNAQSIINQIQDPIARDAVQQQWQTERIAIIAAQRANVGGSTKKASGDGKGKVTSKVEKESKTYNSDGKVLTSKKTTNNKYAGTKKVLTDKQLERKAYEERTGTKLNKKAAVRGASGNGVGNKKKNYSGSGKKVFSTPSGEKNITDKVKHAHKIVDNTIKTDRPIEDSVNYNATLGQTDTQDGASVNPDVKLNMTAIIRANPAITKTDLEDVLLWKMKGYDNNDDVTETDYRAYKTPEGLLEAYVKGTKNPISLGIKDALANLKKNKRSTRSVTTSQGSTILTSGQRQTVAVGSDTYKAMTRADAIFTKAANINAGKKGHVNKKLFGGSKANIADAFDYGQEKKNNKLFVKYKGKKYTPRNIQKLFDAGKKNKDGSLFITADEYGQLAKRQNFGK